MEKILKAIEELTADPALKPGSGVTDVGTLLESGALHAALVRHHIVLIPELLEERSEKNTDGYSLSIIRVLKVRYHLLSSEDKSEICMTVAEEASDEHGLAAGRAWDRCLKMVFSQLLCLQGADEAADPAEMTAEPVQKICAMGRETASEERVELQESIASGETFPPGRDQNHSAPSGRSD